MRNGGVVRAWLVGLVGLVTFAGPAEAEVRIHLSHQGQPLVTDQVFEEDDWVLYHEGDSGYLFSVPRERVERLEIVQGGAVRTIQIPPSAEKFRDSRRRLFMAVLQAEDKHAEDVFKRLQDELRNLGTAASATSAAMRPQGAGGASGVGVSPEAAQFALALQEERVNRVLEEAAALHRRMDRILERAGKNATGGPKPRYYFYR